MHTKQDRSNWPVKDEWTVGKDGYGHFVSRGRYARLIVLSHDCELDKAKNTDGRMGAAVAPLRPMSELGTEQREAVKNGQKLALLPLVGIPTIGDHYADLRAITTIQIKLLWDLGRLASMNEEGVLAVQAGVAGYFSRRLLGDTRGEPR